MELLDGQAHGREHAPHLVLASLVDGELQQRRLAALLFDTRLGGRRAAVFELDAAAQLGRARAWRLATHPRAVGLADAVARVHEAVGQHAVVREDDQAGRLDVEPADRKQDAPVGHQVDDAPARRAGRGASRPRRAAC